MLDFKDFGNTNYDSKEYYTYSYQSFERIFVTMLMMVTTNNTPDLALNDPTRLRLYLFFYVSISLFNLILASGVIIALISQKYRIVFEDEFGEMAYSLSDYHIRLLE